jgi:hypothetical protein
MVVRFLQAHPHTLIGGFCWCSTPLPHGFSHMELTVHHYYDIYIGTRKDGGMPSELLIIALLF